jgi:uncharacterized membrane protein YkvA (DUF1232 family)
MRALLTAMLWSGAVWLVLVGLLFLAGRRAGAKELAMFLPNLIVLFKGLATDSRVPRSSKLLLVFGAAWFASPIDLVPEFIPVLGPLDDAVVAALILRAVVRRAGRQVAIDHWRGEARTLETLLRAAGVGTSA